MVKKLSWNTKTKRTRRVKPVTDLSNKNVGSSQPILNQGEFNEHMSDYFIHSMSPLRGIDNPYFKKMFDFLQIHRSGLSVMSRRSLGRHIQDSHQRMLTDIKKQLQHETKEVCTTADIWSAKKRSFLGVTCHWIDSNLQRKSLTLACRRFSGTHSFNRIALLLENIHTEFNLDCQKVLATVTDNGSNFVKAFKEYGLKENEIFEDEMENESDGDDDQSAVSSTSTSPRSVLHEAGPSNISTSTEGEDIPQLPAHLRCSAHKLSLVCTTYANKVLKGNNTSLSKMHDQVMRKCSTLWNAANRPKTAEIIQNILGHTLSRPGVTRWNSVYDSLRQIESIRTKSAQLHLALGITNYLRERDFQYIEEYLKCSQPIAEALDILQGDKDIFYGILLPTLLSLRRKLIKLTNGNLIYCQALAIKYLTSVEERFSDFFGLYTPTAITAAIAALSYPRFKDKWFTAIDHQHNRRLKTLFKQKIANEVHDQDDGQEGSTSTKPSEDAYFDFETDSSEGEGIGSSIRSTRPDILLANFLSDEDKNISMLRRHAEVMNIFKKFNTRMPSSGPVERLFSYATMINLPKSHRLSDEMFEMRVVLKANLK
ncbi:uncharacterized protein LOC134744914 [Cydia strobilella]|uniref:uncharacterized protein LOC134744914 n=1 Tax=Cydia strobilella TaxID=1100964 RepID=UPI003003DEC8